MPLDLTPHNKQVMELQQKFTNLGGILPESGLPLLIPKWQKIDPSFLGPALYLLEGVDNDYLDYYFCHDRNTVVRYVFARNQWEELICV